MNTEEAKKDLFYWFGVACYRAQGYEYEIRRLLLLNGVLRKADLERHPDFGPLILSKSTLGKLSRALRKYVAHPERGEAQLRDCLQKRNHLIHGFFVDRQDDLNTPEGILSLTKELRAVAEAFQTAIFDLQIASEGIVLSLEFRSTEEWLRAQVKEGEGTEGYPPHDDSVE